MKKSILFVSVFLGIIVALASCKPKSDSAGNATKNTNGGEIVISKSSANPAVVNGFSYEKATLQLPSHKPLVIPQEALVERKRQGDEVEIYLEKSLEFFGHPPSPMHIRDAREYMGIALREEKDAILVATFGEWDSHVEGGASIRVFVCVPEKMELKTVKQLSGEESKAYFDEDGSWMKLMDSPQFKKCYWYGAITPKEGWHKIETQPDMKHRAKKKGF
ncbi:MAG: hypothetical protein GY845_36175 [Planctomycetes bacterium]|nr:hypothetical protein [Planctomycetota bacterium]